MYVTIVVVVKVMYVTMTDHSSAQNMITGLFLVVVCMMIAVCMMLVYQRLVAGKIKMMVLKSSLIMTIQNIITMHMEKQQTVVDHRSPSI